MIHIAPISLKESGRVDMFSHFGRAYTTARNTRLEVRSHIPHFAIASRGKKQRKGRCSLSDRLCRHSCITTTLLSFSTLHAGVTRGVFERLLT